MEATTTSSAAHITDVVLAAHDEELQQCEQPNGLLRRRCRSECLQMSPIPLQKTPHEQNGCDKTNKIALKPPRSAFCTNGDAPIHTNGTIHTNGKHNFTQIEAGGLLHKENSKENIISMNQSDMEIKDYHDYRYEKFQLFEDRPSKQASYLYDLNEEGDRDYFDIMSMVSSDLSDADFRLAEKKLRDDSLMVYNNQNGNFVAADKGHRRIRARSESEQCEFYQVPKQQMRHNEHGKNLFSSNGTDDIHQSLLSTIIQRTPNSVTRGKSLSPPKIVVNKQQLINTNGFLNRSLLNQRLAGRPSVVLRKQKLISKQIAKHSSTSQRSPQMVETVPVDSSARDAQHSTSTELDPKPNASDESEYSSLEDDDDVQEPGDSDENDLLTDSEENYSVENKSMHALTNGSSTDCFKFEHTMLADSVEGQYPKSGPITPSLFAHVPPYITFASHEEKGPPMPAAIKKILKWKLTTITPIVIRKVLLNSGFRLLKQTNDWMGTWGKHMKSPCFRTMRSYQKMNHIPGTFQIGRKDRIWRNLQTQMLRNGKKDFNFMPLTYILPQDLKRLKRLWPRYYQRNTKWIIKPPASARGTGIKVVNKWTQIPKRKPLIVQKYVDRPLLINGSKFDLRLYVLVTSMNPLRVYMHTDGLARFASVKYSDKPDTLSDRYMHLTNYSINKLSSNYAKNEDANSCNGHKWTIKTLWKYLAGQGINTTGLWAALRNLVLKTVLTGEHVINQMSKVNVASKYNTFELFGIDVILDSELKPWLLEVNISPSLHSSSPLDLFVKGPLVTALLNTVLYHVPPRLNVAQQSELVAECGLQGRHICYDKRLYITNLSKVERLKHNRFSQKSITNREQYLDAMLENLTPDDIRCLITTEDELARCSPLERICPTPMSHRYIKFTENPRYYNRLLDAWETRYSKRRQDGIDLLQKYCENKVHLLVPSQPTKLASRNNDENDASNAAECSDEEIDEVFDARIGAVPTKRMEFVETKKPIKVIDECKSPLTVTDDQLTDAGIDQHDILVSTIA